MNSALLVQLENAIRRRRPSLAARLMPGLPETKIREALSNAGITGAVEPLIDLYSWRDGTALNDSASLGEASFFTVEVYLFMGLEAAISHSETVHEAVAQLQEMVQDTQAHDMFTGFSGQLFAAFSNGATSSIVFDLNPGKENRVLSVEFESEQPVRVAYNSFTDFIEDAIRVNKDGSTLRCFPNP